MNLTVVTETALMRAAARLAAALSVRHMVELVATGGALPMDERVAVLYLGDVPEGRVLREGIPNFERFGTRWGVQGRFAWVHATPTADPQQTLAAIGRELEELREVADVEMLDAGHDPSQWKGIQFCARYLDPFLEVPSSTLAGGGMAFTPERMLWERQYTLGIAQLLSDGLDLMLEAVS